ncbi:hypothetical protein ACIA8O_09920 [Kitasatospora sp. NPDC051853]|uniref:hypothetical protein n=1 Tax=Kitasatospora sp. NPDC051853 TaxID=3364058 RepID=UPI003788E742
MPTPAPAATVRAATAEHPPAAAPGPVDHFTGDFETHLTVSIPAARLARLERWADAAGLEVTHIVLARGRTRHQPMLTLTGRGTFPEQRAEALAAAARLRAAGFAVTRIKIEASPWATGVPATAAEAVRLGPDTYFEHHLKVLLPPGPDHEALAELAGRHHAHLSWNARRTDRAGRQQRFVTQRCHRVGLPEAGRQLARLTEAVTGAGYEILSSEREFVVYDDNLAVDHGWLTTGAQR